MVRVILMVKCILRIWVWLDFMWGLNVRVIFRLSLMDRCGWSWGWGWGYRGMGRAWVSVICRFCFMTKLWLDWELEFGCSVSVIIRVWFRVNIPCEWCWGRELGVRIGLQVRVKVSIRHEVRIWLHFKLCLGWIVRVKVRLRVIIKCEWRWRWGWGF